jgi:hypothetical protein
MSLVIAVFCGPCGRDNDAMKNDAVRRAAGHVVGMLCSICAIAQGPRIMDLLICFLGRVGALTVVGGCSGSARLGEGGLHFSWGMALPLVVLVLIMEAAVWLRALYAVPIWLPPIVVAIGCPLVLGVIAGLSAKLPEFLWEIGIVMGLPVAVAFAAYWFPLAGLIGATGRRTMQ